MPSPFPGMDPYLEDPTVWPDVHNSLASEIRDQLNLSLPETYFAQLEHRLEVGIVDDETADTVRMVPDVAVVESRWGEILGGTAVATQPRVELSESVELAWEEGLVKHVYVEVREATGSHRLVTLIELLSPSNKRGVDRDKFLAKQSEVLQSRANFVQIDLLRTGDRLLPTVELGLLLKRRKKRTDYLVLVSRDWKRRAPIPTCQMFPFSLFDPLPCIPLPLKKNAREIPVDLQFLFQRVYDHGPYRRGAIDYSTPPTPPLSKPDAAWAEQVLRPLRKPSRKKSGR